MAKIAVCDICGSEGKNLNDVVGRGLLCVKCRKIDSIEDLTDPVLNRVKKTEDRLKVFKESDPNLVEIKRNLDTIKKSLKEKEFKPCKTQIMGCFEKVFKLEADLTFANKGEITNKVQEANRAVMDEKGKDETTIESIANAQIQPERQVESKYPKNTPLQTGINFELIAELFKRKHDSIIDGEVSITLDEMVPIWTKMFENLSITYLRVTSYIDPIIWDSGFMSIYNQQQRQNIEYILKLAEDTLKMNFNNAESIFKDLKLTWEWADNYFERTFILSKEQLNDADLLVDIIEIICEQTKYFNLRLVNEKVYYNKYFSSI